MAVLAKRACAYSRGAGYLYSPNCLESYSPLDLISKIMCRVRSRHALRNSVSELELTPLQSPLKALESRRAAASALWARRDLQALRTALWESNLECWRRGGWVASIDRAS